MLSHVVSDLYESYVNEVLKPQIGQSGAQEKPDNSQQKSDSAVGGTSVKRIRQAVYDIRYRARREDIPLETAFTQYMSHTSMNSLERKAVREKLGLVSAGGSSIKEELRGHEEKKFKVRVTDKQSGKTYVRSATRRKIQQLRSNPFISSVEMTRYGKGYEGEEKKGEQTASVTSGKGLNSGAGEKYEKKYGKGGKNTVGDLDRDGTKEPNKHEYAGVKDNAIKKAIAKKKGAVKEEFSNWRKDFDIFEATVDDNIESSNAKQIKEKNITNKVKINPDLKETFKNLGGDLIEAVELNEEFINGVIYDATEYFFEQGLNENGVDILIEEIGNEEFSDWVFEISEARSAKKRKGGKSYEEIKAEIDAKEKVKQKLAAAKKEKKVETAKTSQKPTPEKTPASNTKKGILDRVAGAVMSGVERHQKATADLRKKYEAGVQRHKQATQTASKLAKETGKTAVRVGKVAAHVGSHAASTVEKAAKGAKKVITQEEARNPYAIGMAAAMDSTGDEPPLKKSTIKKAHKIAKKIEAKEEVENFREAISTVTGKPDPKMGAVQKDTEHQQTKNARQKLEKIMTAKREAIRSGITNVSV